MPTRRKADSVHPATAVHPPISPPSALANLRKQAQQPRRATRQTPIPPPIPPLASAVPPRPSTSPVQHKISLITPVSPPQIRTNGTNGQPVAKRGRGRPRKNSAVSPEQSRTWPQSTSAIPLPDMASLMSKDFRSSDLVAPDITYHIPHHTATQPGRPSALVRPQGPGAPPPRSNARPPQASTITPIPAPKPATKPGQAGAPRADRNIDKVVFGSLCFRTWYPSYYGKEVLGDVSGNASRGSKEAAVADPSKAHAVKKHDQHHMLERLYVCPSCFKYSKELVAWWGHVRICEQQGHVPGTKVYTHPRGKRKVLVPVGDGGRAGSGTGSAKKRRGESVRYIEETVEDEGEWSIWEVDGEKDGVSGLSTSCSTYADPRSCSARTSPCSRSYSSTTSPSSSTSRASTTSSSSTRRRPRSRSTYPRAPN